MSWASCSSSIVISRACAYVFAWFVRQGARNVNGSAAKTTPTAVSSRTRRPPSQQPPTRGKYTRHYRMHRANDADTLFFAIRRRSSNDICHRCWHNYESSLALAAVKLVRTSEWRGRLNITRGISALPSTHGREINVILMKDCTPIQTWTSTTFIDLFSSST